MVIFLVFILIIIITLKVYYSLYKCLSSVLSFYTCILNISVMFIWAVNSTPPKSLHLINIFLKMNNTVLTETDRPLVFARLE